MTNEVLVCPECRARVFGEWSACKFCGAVLRVTEIGGTVDPDELVAGQGTSGGGGSGSAAGPRSPWASAQNSPSGAGGSTAGAAPELQAGSGVGSDTGTDAPGGWSSWAGSEAEGAGTASRTHDWDSPPALADVDPFGSFDSAAGSAAPTSGASTGLSDPGGAASSSDESVRRASVAGGTVADDAAGTLDVPTGTSTGAELVPLEGGAQTWTEGPAPSIDDDGPSGLDPVSWYPEPGAPAADESPSGLDPMSWYPEPGAAREDDAPRDESSGSAAPDDDDAESAHERFDPGAIFREPEETPAPPIGGMPATSALEPTVPEVKWTASADAWATPVEPTGKPKGQAVLSREARLLLMGILLVVVVIAGMKVFGRGQSYPSEWSGNVEQVANWVSAKRDLPFRHPVAVVTWNAGRYDAAVHAAEVPQKSQQELTDQVPMWRALGGLQGNPTAALGVVAEQRPEFGAFFDPTDDQLVLRSGTDPAQLRVAAAGALSVALDSQHGNFSTLTKPAIAESPLESVVAGNAAAMRAAYFATLTADQRHALGALVADPLSPDANLLDARAALQPGTGRPFVDLVRAVDGTSGVNDLVENPPISSQQILDGSAYFTGEDPLSGVVPQAPQGTQTLENGTLGAEGWYLLVAGRLSAGTGFDMIDNWAGDNYVAFRKRNGQVCVTDVLRGADASTTQVLKSMLDKWAATIPGGHVDVKQSSDTLVTVAGCDPGASADQGLHGLERTAVQAAVARAELASYYYLRGTKIPNGPNGPLFTPQVAWCLSDHVVHGAQPDMISQVTQHRGGTFRSLTLAAGKSCGSQLVGQLFTGSGS